MRPLNINKESCVPVSSNCVIWQGPDLECIGLCKGAVITQVVYEMATKICAILDTLNVDSYDISCLNSTACPPETFIELIQLIIQSICDINVQNGEDGANGNYTEVEAFEPGLNDCVNGGISITTFDGPTGEQINQFFICNPEDGEDGGIGPQGPRGDYVQISAATLEQCPTGGFTISLLDGVTDDTLSTSTVCNGSCECDPLFNFYGENIETLEVKDQADPEEYSFPSAGYSTLSYTNSTGVSMDLKVEVSYDHGRTVGVTPEWYNDVRGAIVKTVASIDTVEYEHLGLNAIVNTVNFTLLQKIENVSFFKKVTLGNNETISLKFRTKDASAPSQLYKAQIMITQL